MEVLKMIDLYHSEITDILPENLRQYPDCIAISYAISNQVKKTLDYAKNISIYACIDRLPSEILDLLAIELRTQYYNQNLSIDVKRILIKNTLPWYERAGTPSAVEELITAVFGYGKEIEWYEYGGKPGYFKIEATNQGINGKQQKEFLQILECVKRKSAWLDTIKIVTNGEADINIFLATTDTSFEYSKPVKIGG
jgi:P2-related tail formation protein